MIDDEGDGSGARDGHEDGWWTDLYDDTVAEVLMRRTPEESAAACDYLTRALALSPGARVFDQGCGPGGLAVPLAQRGMRVFGVDLNGGYIERARAAAEAARVEATFLVGDAFYVVPPWPCDAALCWGTGFGNAARDEDNLRMLRCAFEGLRPGGRFALDFQNVARILMVFQPGLIQRGTVPGGEALILRESRLELRAGQLLQRWTLLTPDGGRREARSAVRLYLPHELRRLLEAAGFADVTFHGDIDGSPLSERSPRCIALARRPARSSE